MRHLIWTCLVVAAVLAGMAPDRIRAEERGAGFVDLQLTDPVEGGQMPAIVFYPTKSDGGSTQVGPFTIEATRDAAPAPGAYPLIVHSHGTGGSHLGHHDTLAALARAGFVAAAVEHPRDNFRDSSGFATDLQLIGRPHHIVALIDGVLAHATVGPLVDRARIGMAGFVAAAVEHPRDNFHDSSGFATDLQLIGRPHHIVALIDGVLAHATVGPLVDRARIGMAGFSAGGYTTLLIAGAVPDFSLMGEYRKAVPYDPLRRRADAAGKQRRKPDLKVVADPRVRAVFLMAPALGYVFDKSGLSKVEVPVRLYRPTADEVLAHPWNAERIARMLPRPPEYELVQGAGHYVFLPPCPMLLALRIPAICKDPRGVDRAAFHVRLNAEMIDFFRRTLTP